MSLVSLDKGDRENERREIEEGENERKTKDTVQWRQHGWNCVAWKAEKDALAQVVCRTVDNADVGLRGGLDKYCH